MTPEQCSYLSTLSYTKALHSNHDHLQEPATREAVIMYQGTAGPQGWNEDFKSGYKPITDGQKQAIDYAKKMTKELDGF